VAMSCAAGVYDEQHIPPDVEGLQLRQLQYFPHSGNGTIKSAALTLVQDVSLNGTANPLLPVLVLAIRGSKTVVDWMVNLNSRTGDSTELFVSCHSIPLSGNYSFLTDMNLGYNGSWWSRNGPGSCGLLEWCKSSVSILKWTP
jgi:hypothetical protein